MSCRPLLESAEPWASSCRRIQLTSCSAKDFEQGTWSEVVQNIALSRRSPAMVFLETKLPGLFEIHIDARPDDRGFFARTWCQEEFTSCGLSGKVVQCSMSFSARRGTLRGL